MVIKLRLARVRAQFETERENGGTSGCLHHFGYLARRPENAPIPQECFICPRMTDCMVVTVFLDEEK